MSFVQSNKTPALASSPEVAVNLINMRGALDSVLAKLRASEGFTLFTLNLDHVVKLNENLPFLEAYQRANFITADGWPVVWVIQKERRQQLERLGVQRERRAVERTTGADLLAPMCQQSAQHGYPIYFVGPGAASQSAGIDILRARYPQLVVAGAETPDLSAHPDQKTIDALGARIANSGARICVLSLGAPKQEVLADALHRLCPGVGFICVGAALDFISGHAVRAPGWIQKSKMEWAWRLAKDPRRLAYRYARCGMALLKLALPGLFPSKARLRISIAV